MILVYMPFQWTPEMKVYSFPHAVLNYDRNF